MVLEKREVLDRNKGGFVPDFIAKYDYKNGRIYYSFNEKYENGLVIRKEYLYYDTDESIANQSIEQVFSYSENGLPESVINREYRNGDFVNLSQVFHSYNKKNKLKSRLYRTWLNESWVDVRVDSVFYSEINKPVRKTSYSFMNDSMQYISEEIISYDDYLMPIEIVKISENGSYQTLYDNSKNQTNSITYLRRVNEEWEPYLRDKRDDENTFLRQINSEGSWVDVKKTEKSQNEGVSGDCQEYLLNQNSYNLVYLDTTGLEGGLPFSRITEVYSLYSQRVINGLKKDFIYEPANKNSTTPQVNVIKELPESLIRFYPNPASDVLHIELPDSQKEIVIRFHDINGRKVFYQKINAQNSGLSVNISELSNGVYFVELISGNRLKTLKFVKN